MKTHEYASRYRRSESFFAAGHGEDFCRGLGTLSAEERGCPEEKKAHRRNQTSGFTLVELVVVLLVLVLLGLLLVPTLARTRTPGPAFACLNNVRQLATAWRQRAADHDDWLVTANSGFLGYNANRPLWMDGTLDYSTNPANYDVTFYVKHSPLFQYLASSVAVFKCPADKSTVISSTAYQGFPIGSKVPRTRSFSMNDAFGGGLWLDPGHSPPEGFRIYQRVAEIGVPSKTFVFIDEHPGSINDGAFATQCGGNQPSDAPSSSKIIEMPANWHAGRSSLVYSDGHAELHKWESPYLRTLPNDNGFYPPLVIGPPAGDDQFWIDAHWLAAITTLPQ